MRTAFSIAPHHAVAKLGRGLPLRNPTAVSSNALNHRSHHLHPRTGPAQALLGPWAAVVISGAFVFGGLALTMAYLLLITTSVAPLLGPGTEMAVLFGVGLLVVPRAEQRAPGLRANDPGISRMGLEP